MITVVISQKSLIYQEVMTRQTLFLYFLKVTKCFKGRRKGEKEAEKEEKRQLDQIYSLEIESMNQAKAKEKK